MNLHKLWYSLTDSRVRPTKLQIIIAFTIAVVIMIRLFIDEPGISVFLYGVLGLVALAGLALFVVFVVRAFVYLRDNKRTHRKMRPFRTRLINSAKRLRD